MFDTSPVPSFLCEERTLAILLANQAALGFYGYTEEQFLALKVPDLVAPDHWQVVQENMAAGAPRGVENVHVHADGRLLPVCVSAHRLDLPMRPLWNVQVTDRSMMVGAVRQSVVAAVTSVERALRARDPYTANHQVRVALLATTIAELMTLPDQVRESLRIAAELHDIGKIGLPSEILNFPGRLSAPAVELIRTHAQIGHDMIDTIPFEGPVARIVLEHHERLDGSGYPHGGVGDDLLVESRVLAVADVVEAMTAHRPYRPALPMEAALEEIRGGRGRLYEPEVVDACLHLITETGFQFPGPALG